MCTLTFGCINADNISWYIICITPLCSCKAVEHLTYSCRFMYWSYLLYLLYEVNGLFDILRYSVTDHSFTYDLDANCQIDRRALVCVTFQRLITSCDQTHIFLYQITSCDSYCVITLVSRRDQYDARISFEVCNNRLSNSTFNVDCDFIFHL